MLVTNYYGREVTCCECKCKDLHEYKVYTPAFASAINSVFIGWCIEHKAIGLAQYRKAIGETDRLNQASSNS
jgi:hypothetical protein